LNSRFEGEIMQHLGPQALRDTRLVCASLMVSLIPLHEGIAKQRKFYSLAKQLFDEYLNSSDKGAVQNSE
jgi:hypothetical protein